MTEQVTDDETVRLLAVSGFKRDCLRVVMAIGPASGVQIKSVMEPHIDGDISSGKLYPTLNALVERGWIEKDERGGEENAAHQYDVTTEGEVVLREYWTWNTTQDT